MAKFISCLIPANCGIPDQIARNRIDYFKPCHFISKDYYRSLMAKEPWVLSAPDGPMLASRTLLSGQIQWVSMITSDHWICCGSLFGHVLEAYEEWGYYLQGFGHDMWDKITELRERVCPSGPGWHDCFHGQLNLWSEIDATVLTTRPFKWENVFRGI